MLVRHAMTRGVFTVRETEDCREVLDTFRRDRIRRAPVVRGEELVGIVSERDLLRVVPNSIALLECAVERGIDAPKIATAMTKSVLTVSPDLHLEDAANLMHLRRIGGLPVVDGKTIVGMLTETDIFRAFVALWHDEATVRVTLAPPKGDARQRPADEPLRIALDLGLDVMGLNTFRAPGGVRLTSLRVRGARAGDLPERLAAKGWNLIEVERRGAQRVA
ncbi:MAG: CBS domain-containing protein [Planctomycetes bacterium]|nr:CBS domain-containing protein [Planctomycetota bacterium]